MAFRRLPLAQVYGLLEPGPVVLLATAAKGRANAMCMSWHTMLEFEPPLVACVVSDRNPTFAVLRRTREAVIAIPTVDIAREALRFGNASARRVDKFASFGLTTVPASQVGAPLITECYANLECRVVDTRMVTKYGLFVLEVVAAWIDRSRRDPRTLHHRGRGRFMIAGTTVRLPSRAK